MQLKSRVTEFGEKKSQWTGKVEIRSGRNFWQWEKYARLYFDLLQALNGSPLWVINIGDLSFCVCSRLSPMGKPGYLDVIHQITNTAPFMAVVNFMS